MIVVIAVQFCEYNKIQKQRILREQTNGLWIAGQQSFKNKSLLYQVLIQMMKTKDPVYEDEKMR